MLTSWLMLNLADPPKGARSEVCADGSTRRLRSWARHERMSMALSWAEDLHHSCDRKDEDGEEARGRVRGVRSAQSVPRDQKTLPHQSAAAALLEDVVPAHPLSAAYLLSLDVSQSVDEVLGAGRPTHVQVARQ